MGRAQFAHVAVGTPVRDEGFSQWSFFAIEGFGGPVFDGRGSGRLVGDWVVAMLEVGGSWLTLIAGMDASSGVMIMGSEDSSSNPATLIVGTAGDETVMVGI